MNHLEAKTLYRLLSGGLHTDEALGTLYKLRAEIGFFGGQVVSDLVAPAVESEVAQ